MNGLCEELHPKPKVRPNEYRGDKAADHNRKLVAVGITNQLAFAVNRHRDLKFRLLPS